MKKITVLILTVIIAALSLCGCGAKSSDAPDGMQLVRGGDALGYYLYAPIGWVVANQGRIASTYVSTIDTTSVTLVEAEMPTVGIDEYFAAAEADFAFPINVTVRNESFKLGNAEEARQFVYDYEYSDFKFRTMQIFARFDGRFYIFTFTSQLTERTEGESYYDFHLNNSLGMITDNVKFVKRSGTEPTPEYPEVDGRLLVSDSALCGFELYVPKEYKVDYSHGIVSVTREDGANITVAKATSGGVSIGDYWSNRKSELETIFGEITEIKVNNVEGVSLGNLTTAASYEYTYEYGGVRYHVYQVFAVDAFDGYAFTFTAPEEIYGERIGEALDVASRIRF